MIEITWYIPKSEMVANITICEAHLREDIPIPILPLFNRLDSLSIQKAYVYQFTLGSSVSRIVNPSDKEFILWAVFCMLYHFSQALSA